MAYKNCEICGEFDWFPTGLSGGHKCPPKWFVRDADSDRDSEKVVYAGDAEAAAEKYAEETMDSMDYSSGLTVIVINAEETEQSWIDVEVEAVPSFSSHTNDTKPLDKEQE
jgi:hypothetical protein